MAMHCVPRVPGLTVSSIPEEFWRPALDEANGIFAKFTAGQIGSNQKFFINMPFPLSGEREAATPIFCLGDPRISQIEQVVHTVFSSTPGVLGFGLENLEDLRRANVIVREYRPGQKISFHSDDELCGPRVFGIVLENGRPDMGLVLRKGSGAAVKSQRNVKHEDEYVMREEPGTIFLMEDQARYQWQHGLPPVPTRRVSITVRFFKKGIDLGGLEIPYVEEHAVLEGCISKSAEVGRSASNANDARSETGLANTDEDEAIDIVAKSTSLTVTLINNNDNKAAKPFVMNSVFSASTVGTAAKAKLRLKGNVAEYRYFLLFGVEVFDGDEVIQKHKAHILNSPSAQSSMRKNVDISDIVIYIAEKKENYKGPLLKVAKDLNETKRGQPMPKVQRGSPKDLAAAYKCGSNYEAVMHYAEKIWSKWHYPKLRFYAHSDVTTGDVPGLSCLDACNTSDLGDLIEHRAHLSVPECRELLQFVTSIFAMRSDRIEEAPVPDYDPMWHFYSCLWDSEHEGVSGEIVHNGHNLTDNDVSAAAAGKWYKSIQPYSGKEKGFQDGRMVGIILVFPKECKYVDFRVEGTKALKGSKKRDGPLWSLQGGLNNWDENNTMRKPGGSSLGSDDRIATSSAYSVKASDAPHRTSTKRVSSQFKGKNKYQQQRGVCFSKDFVFFGGTTFLSTYYPVKTLNLDGKDYSSAAQFVMAEQARIFEDTERIQELEMANNTAQPHKVFDHKAPKTNVRRLKNFNPDIWKKHRDNVMHRATFEKFMQNKDIRTRLLMVGPNRRIVEATEDPFWGSGILLGSEDFDKPDKWTGLNNMGLLLDRVARDIRRKFPEEAKEIDRAHGNGAVSASCDSENACVNDDLPFCAVEHGQVGQNIQDLSAESCGIWTKDLIDSSGSEAEHVGTD